MNTAHSHRYYKKIYYHDTDCGGVVYYANYLKYLEEARTEMLSERGISMLELAQRGLGFAVAKAEIEYKRPARYLDTLEIVSTIERIKLSIIQLRQSIVKDSEVLSEAVTKIMLVDSDFKPVNIPDDIKRLLL